MAAMTAQVDKPRIKLTYEDYRHTPEDARYELIDGELILAAAPRTTHQRLQTELGWRMGQLADENDLGAVFFSPTDVVLSATDVVQPDLIFISKERARIIAEEAVFGAPDLIIEILSPSTAARDMGCKRDLYERHSVKEYWMADVDSVWIRVLRLNAAGFFEVVGTYGEGDTFTSTVLAGFTVNVSEVFGL